MDSEQEEHHSLPDVLAGRACRLTLSVHSALAQWWQEGEAVRETCECGSSRTGRWCRISRSCRNTCAVPCSDNLFPPSSRAGQEDTNLPPSVSIIQTLLALSARSHQPQPDSWRWG
eukprot:3215442-Amphidinium_carterae.1